MAISWRGYGLLGFMPPLLAALIASLFSPGMSGPAFIQNFQIGLVLLSIGMWLVGKHLNGDAQAQEAPHLFMGLRLQHAGLIWVGLLIVYVIAS